VSQGPTRFNRPSTPLLGLGQVRTLVALSHPCAPCSLSPPTTHHPQPTGQANGAGSSLGQHNQAAHWSPRCLGPSAGRRGVRCGGQCTRASHCRRPRGLQLRWGWVACGKRHVDSQLACDCQSIPPTIHSLPTTTTPRRLGHHAAPRGDCVGRLRPSGAHAARGQDPKRRWACGTQVRWGLRRGLRRGRGRGRGRYRGGRWIIGSCRCDDCECTLHVCSAGMGMSTMFPPILNLNVL
jgi:hypothetical protein